MCNDVRNVGGRQNGQYQCLLMILYKKVALTNIKICVIIEVDKMIWYKIVITRSKIQRVLI